jgi:hypothetical protein
LQIAVNISFGLLTYTKPGGIYAVQAALTGADGKGGGVSAFVKMNRTRPILRDARSLQVTVFC